MSDFEIKCSVRESPDRCGVEVYFYESNYVAGKHTLIKVNGFEREREEYKRGEHMPHPSMFLDRVEAKLLLSALSDIGFTPDSSAERKGELKATKGHLEDMRRLVFEEKHFESRD